MKKLLSLAFGATLFTFCYAQDNVGIGTNTPNASSMLDVVSANKGVLIPRMNTAAMNAIVVSAATNGLIIYNTDSSCFCYYNATVWVSLCNAGATGPTGPAGTPGPAGPAGANGANGTNGTNGINCWDLNGNGVNDPAEDINGDGFWNSTDCVVGSPGPTGPTGAAGINGTNGTNGLNCWDLNGNGTNDPAEDINIDGFWNALDCAGAAGATGPTGAAGANGATGPTGNTGPAGPAGPAGAAGPAGPAGPIGPTGANGTAIFYSATGTTDATVTTTAWTAMPQMSITYTPTKSTGYVFFSASGYGWTNSMSYLACRLRVGGVVQKGTTEKIQNYDDVTGTITTWSLSLIYPISVTIGSPVTVDIQWMRDGISGTYHPVNNVATAPNECHRTIVIME